MFTGIIKEIGRVKNLKKNGKEKTISLEIICKMKPKIGASIGVNGACLTVTKKTKNGFCADVVNETLAKTNLGKINIGAKVNLEPSMAASDSFGGHFVSGHVDAICEVMRLSNNKLTIKIPKNLLIFTAKKGSIAINGASLTIVEIKGDLITIALIPFTLKNTNLGKLNANDYVNVEVDLIARYLYSIFKK